LKTTAKIISSIIARCLLKHFESLGPSNQFGQVGCQEALHASKTYLTLQCQHGLDSHILFINLVKAFDTINHNMMWAILSKYGLPDEIINVIKKLYENCQVQFTADGKTRDVKYTIGVQQGNNMVPPLFIYIMQAAMETLAKLDASRRKPELRFFPKQKGRLTNQVTKTVQGTESFEMMGVLFIDDTAIICKTREDIKKISQLILDHLTKFSLQMHTRTRNNKSKMEAMYFPESVSEAK